MVKKNTIIILLLLILFFVWITPCDADEEHHSLTPAEPTYQPQPIILQVPDFSPCAATAAISGVPGISHHANHTSHTSLGIGLGGCEGSTGAAIGLTHQQDDMSFKANIGVSGTTTVFSGGASVKF